MTFILRLDYIKKKNQITLSNLSSMHPQHIKHTTASFDSSLTCLCVSQAQSATLRYSLHSKSKISYALNILRDFEPSSTIARLSPLLEIIPRSGISPKERCGGIEAVASPQPLTPNSTIKSDFPGEERQPPRYGFHSPRFLTMFGGHIRGI